MYVARNCFLKLLPNTIYEITTMEIMPDQVQLFISAHPKSGIGEKPKRANPWVSNIKTSPDCGQDQCSPIWPVSNAVCFVWNKLTEHQTAMN
jgi:hypothetical protein